MAIQIAKKPSKIEQQKALLGGSVPKKQAKAVQAKPLQKPVEKDLDLSVIRLDQSAQPREHLSTDKTSEYAEAMEAGAVFPPLVVFFDGKNHWLADGFHRHYAYQQVKRKQVRCLVHAGGLRDAILYSVGANADHGLPRTDVDKRRAVSRLLNDAEWSLWSDNDIRKQCRVSLSFVQNRRKDHTYREVSEKVAPPPNVPDAVRQRAEEIQAEGGTPRFFKNRHGGVSVMNVAGINASRNESQAKTSEDNGATVPQDELREAADSVAGEASRVDAGRTTSATSERMDVTGGESAAAHSERRENDFYPTPESLIAEIVARWKPTSKVIWEPCVGDGRVASALRIGGYEVVSGDITQGDDFFAQDALPQPGIALCTNPPFGRLREFIDHAFAIGIHEMCLVLPERVWASGIGRKQFERHRPSVWANLDWREDYLGKGGSPDRALAVAIWNGPCAASCEFQVWDRAAELSA